MKKVSLAALAVLTAISTACGNGSDGGKASGQVTETRMNDIDAIEGTINDDMIDTDDSTETTPLAKDDGKEATNSSSSSDSADDNSQEETE